MLKSFFQRSLILLAVLTLIPASLPALGPTTTQNGYWEAISSFQVVRARINGQNEQVCLPKIIFKEEVDPDLLKEQIKKGIPGQEAIFHLYHDGLGRPKKQGGMFYASDVFLKDMKVTYIGYLQKLGYSFTVSSKPAFEDPEYMRSVAYSKHITGAMAERDKAAAAAGSKADGSKDPKRLSASSMRV
ncbi:MAG: hypothetical protein PHD82_06295, partial [Candidatus Riflebacteria bacterium]|nr:hypothetical protein [Candidatus Riflebacteria bacterium]